MTRPDLLSFLKKVDIFKKAYFESYDWLVGWTLFDELKFIVISFNRLNLNKWQEKNCQKISV